MRGPRLLRRLLLVLLLLKVVVLFLAGRGLARLRVMAGGVAGFRRRRLFGRLLFAISLGMRNAD